MAKCSTCLLPEGTFNVDLQGGDTCNLCSFYATHGAAFGNPAALRPRMLERFDKLRGKYEYDALVGVSGGKDSAYILWKLVKEHNLNVLAITYNNGFLSDLARQNVKSIVDSMGIDHVFYEPDWEVHKSFYRATLTKTGDACLACGIAGYFLATKLCLEKRIPLFVHGRSPYQMLKNLSADTKDVFLAMLKANMGPHSFATLAAVNREIDARIKAWLSQLYDGGPGWKPVYEEFFPDPATLTDEFTPEFLAFFLFEPYDEEEIKRTMEREVGYRRPSDDHPLGHGDCTIHEASGHIFKRINGISLIAPEIAVMLRQGKIDRAGAEEILGQDARGGEPTESLRELCDRLELSPEDIERVIEGARQRFAVSADSLAKTHWRREEL